MKTGTHSLDLVIRETVNTLVQTEHVHKICITSAYQVQLSLLLKSAPPSTPTQESHARLTIAGQWPETVQAWVTDQELPVYRLVREQYCIGIWNVSSMNQGKWDVVKQEMVRININILGISELKWMGMGEFHSDDHCIYYCGQESHRRNGVAIIINKRVWSAVLGYNLRNDRMISVPFQASHSTSQWFKSMPLPPMLKKLKLIVLWRPRRPPRTNTKKRCSVYSSLGVGMQM